jgi:muramoyltetrapeptide carboxypeptidase LdcA involved in peptidoglycan recycling
MTDLAIVRYTLSDDIHPGVALLRSLVAAARSRLAEIETKYTEDWCAVEATQAKLLNLVKQHYQERDRLRLIVRDRRKYLEVLVAVGEREAGNLTSEHQTATTEAASNSERTISAAERGNELGDETECELRKLWKQLILLGSSGFCVGDF